MSFSKVKYCKQQKYPNKIQRNFVYSLSSVLVLPLHTIYNTLLLTGMFHSECKNEVVPVLRLEKKDKMSNYVPIVILSIYHQEQYQLQDST